MVHQKSSYISSVVYLRTVPKFGSFHVFEEFCIAVIRFIYSRSRALSAFGPARPTHAKEKTRKKRLDDNFDASVDASEATYLAGRSLRKIVGSE
jgi:hypothetical protein